MSYSKGHTVNCNRVTLGGIFSDDSDTINIVHSDPAKKILVNGVEPSAGGGVTDPLNVNNLNASVALTTPSITPPVAGGGLVIKANGLIKPDGAGEILNISASTIETVDGDISTSGTGSVRVQGTGFISCGTTITAVGDISTGGNGDIVSGRDIYFDGTDIYKRTDVGGLVNDTEYKDYKGLVATNDNAIFTAEPVFRKTIKVQTSDGAVPPNLTDQITLNQNGTIQCANANIGTALTVGTITCDNGGANECKARLFNTRTSGTAGWNITQALEEAAAPQNAANNILQFAATQAQAAGIPTQIYVTASDYDPTQGDSPSVIIDPVTTASGGRVQSSQFITGTTTGRYVLKQDVGGTLDQVLQVNPPSATAEVRFKDNVGGETMTIKNASVDLGNAIPLNFGGYSFRPQQYSRDITLTIDGTKDTSGFTNMIFNPRNSPDTWTNVNTGATNQTLYNAALVGYYKCTVTQTGVSSAGNYDGIKVICDYVLQFSQQSSPDIQPPITYGYTIKPSGGQPPTVEVDHTNVPVQSQPVFLLFPNQNAGETMPMTVKLTKMDY